MNYDPNKFSFRFGLEFSGLLKNSLRTTEKRAFDRRFGVIVGKGDDISHIVLPEILLIDLYYFGFIYKDNFSECYTYLLMSLNSSHDTYQGFFRYGNINARFVD